MKCQGIPIATMPPLQIGAKHCKAMQQICTQVSAVFINVACYPGSFAQGFSFPRISFHLRVNKVLVYSACNA